MKKILHKFNKVIIGVIAIVVSIGILGFFYKYSQRSEAGTVDVPVTFSKSEITFDGILDSNTVSDYVEINLMAGGNRLSGATALLSYPKDIVTATIDNTYCKGLDSSVTGEVNSDEGTIVVTRVSVVDNDDLLPTGIVCFARINVTPIAAGTGSLNFIDGPLGTRSWQIVGLDHTFTPDYADQEVTISVGSSTITPTPQICMGVQHCTNGSETMFEYCGDCTGVSCHALPNYGCRQAGFTCTTYRDKFFGIDTLYPVPCNLLPSITPSPTPSPTNTPSPTITPSTTISPTPLQTTPETGTSTNITFDIRTQGVTQAAKNVNEIPVRVMFLKDDKTVVDERTVSMSKNGDGTWTGTSKYDTLLTGTDYTLLIKGPKHLQKKICSNNPTEKTGGQYSCKNGAIRIQAGDNRLDLKGVTLLGGDIPLQNGIVDAVDITYIRSNLGKTDADIVARGDLNYDGIVDSQDYGIIINALSFKYDEEE